MKTHFLYQKSRGREREREKEREEKRYRDIVKDRDKERERKREEKGKTHFYIKFKTIILERGHVKFSNKIYKRYSKIV